MITKEQHKIWRDNNPDKIKKYKERRKVIYNNKRKILLQQEEEWLIKLKQFGLEHRDKHLKLYKIK